jgi:FkbM family methyltransferase
MGASVKVRLKGLVMNQAVQSIGRLMPQRSKHWCKLLIYPDYRHKQRELARLSALPRYTAAATHITGRQIELVDAASFIYMYKDIYEQEIYRFPSNSDRPFIIDGGANIGLSVLYFKELYPHSRIVAFEPDDKIFAVLERNVEGGACHDVELVCRALWSSETSLTFMSEGADGGRVARPQDAQNKVVETVRLRDYLGDRRVDLLKLDIEGAETEVLVDCADRLGNVERLFVEYHSFAQEPQTLHTITNVLAAAGFRLHIHPNITSPRPFVSRDLYGGTDLLLNIFAFRD